MPELPDITVFVKNLKDNFYNAIIRKVKIINGHKLTDKPSAIIRAMEGKKVKDIFRSGKEIRLTLSSGTEIGIHLMLTGDLIPFEIKNTNTSTIAEIYFVNGKSLALTDRMKNAWIKLQPQNKEGIDALDPALNFYYLKKICNRKANIKNVLKNQDLIRGIGNGYSDEILWEAKISPFSVANKIPDEQLKILLKKIKVVLKRAIKLIDKNYPGIIHGEIKDYLHIHTKKKTHSPTGYPIQQSNKGKMKTFYTAEQLQY